VNSSLRDRIKEFHDGTVVVEPLNIVPRGLSTDALLFQKDKDQIDWFRQMEAIEVQELAIRFLSQPGHHALTLPGLTVPAKEATAMGETTRLHWEQEPATAVAVDGVTVQGWG
jgi:hypothetical protein